MGTPSSDYIGALQNRLGWHPTVQRIVARVRSCGADVRTRRGLIQSIRRRGMEDRRAPRTYAESVALYREWQKERAACKTARLAEWMERTAAKFLADRGLDVDQLCGEAGVRISRARSLVLALVCAAYLRGLDPVAVGRKAAGAVWSVRRKSGCDVKTVRIKVVWGDQAPVERGQGYGWRWRGRWKWARGSYIYSTLRVEVGFEWLIRHLDELIGGIGERTVS